MYRSFFALSILATSSTLTPWAGADVIIASEVGDLTYTDSGGASSSVSVDGSTLTIDTSKNGAVQGAFSSVSIPDDGDSLMVDFDLQFDVAPASGSSFYVDFTNSSSGDYYRVAFDAGGGSQSVVFSEDGDTNLGKFTGNALGTSSQQVTFSLTRNSTGDGMDLTLDSSLIQTSPRTVGNDISPVASTFDRVSFGFTGDAFNNQEIVATISNLTLTTTVPEPGTIVLTLLGLGLLTSRRRVV